MSRSFRLIAWLLIVVLTCFVECASAEEDGKLELRRKDGDRPMLVYNAGFLPSPDAAAPWFGRSGFIHPFLTPKGRAVTEAFPPDHLHQHGLMFAWTSTVIDGNKVDFWNSRLRQGHVEHVKTIVASNERIEVHLRHVWDGVEPAVVAIQEAWELTRVDHAEFNIFDLKSTQVCVMNESLKIDAYHYGAMCVRGPSEWLDSTEMATNEGENQQSGNHTRPDWVAMWGRGLGQPAGIVAMSHPANFRSPQHVRLHPKKPYFCFLPMVERPLELKPKVPYVSRFRFVAFDGKLDTKKVGAVCKQFQTSGK